MRNPGSQTPELALPVASLAALREALLAEIGANAAARVLQAAGHAAGDALFEILDAGAGAAPDGGTGALGEAAFWRRLNDLFATRGWGHLEHDALHPGVGALESGDWVEAEAAGSAGRPSCFFTTGMLARILGRTAGADLAVLEAECRARGDLHCRFLFGGPEALSAVYDALCAGEDVDRSVADLV